MEQRISLITLGVADLRRSLDFYEKGLGWIRSEKRSGDMIAFDMPGLNGGFVQNRLSNRRNHHPVGCLFSVGAGIISI